MSSVSLLIEISAMQILHFEFRFAWITQLSFLCEIELAEKAKVEHIRLLNTLSLCFISLNELIQVKQAYIYVYKHINMVLFSF